jgi:hypothetical protein
VRNTQAASPPASETTGHLSEPAEKSQTTADCV